MIRKTPLSHATRESTSSEETATSRPPKDVLALGVHLVRELGLARGNDTLGRWLCHHLAERMDAAERATSPAEKSERVSQAVDVILRIWERRAVLPGQANPLARYREALSELTNRSNVYWNLTRRETSGRKALAKKIVRDSERLELLVDLLDSGTDIDEKAATDDSVLSFLSKEERDTLSALDRFLNLAGIGFGPRNNNAEARQNVRPARQTIESFVAEMAKDVERIRGMLGSRSVGRPGRKSQRSERKR
jgi:hypothetical protein